MIAEAVLKEAYESKMERLARLRVAWDAYLGKMPKPLKATKSDPLAKDNIILNFASPIVNKGVSFLMGQEVCFEVQKDKAGQIGTDSDEADPDETESLEDVWLDDCWAQNKKMSLLHLLAINGGVTGDVFVKTRPPNPALGLPYPRLVNLDPANVTPIWQRDDFEDIIGWLLQWNVIEAGQPAVRRQIIEPMDGGGQWMLTDEISRGNSQTWQPLETSVFPYPFSPIHHTQNLPMPNEFFGLSDIEAHVLSVNDAINFVLSNMARIVRTHAHPKTWGKGFNAKQLDNSVENLSILASPDAMLANLEMQSDLGSSLELYKRLKEAFHEITAVPEVAVGKMDNVGTLSGVALQILYQSLIEKNGTKQLFYGDFFAMLNRCLLEMGGQGIRKVVKNQWPDPLPKDTLTEANTATVLEPLGVSTDTLLTSLGFDAAQEKKKKLKETKEKQALMPTPAAPLLPAKIGSQNDQGNLDNPGGGTSGA